MPNTNIADKVAKRIAEDTTSALDNSYKEMFGLPAEAESVVKLPVRNLHDYKNDPFKDRTGEEMEQLVASIRENGLQNPIIVRLMSKAGQYEILAGRRRVNAIKQIGIMDVDAIIRDADDNEAAFIVTETNLRSRQKLFHSEKAFAYKLQLDAIKQQGKRTDAKDITCAQFAHKKSRDIIAEKNDVSKDEIQRYIRLTQLIPPLLDLLDDEKIPFMAGVDLSYLDEAAQGAVYAFFYEAEYGTRLDLKITASLRNAFKEIGRLTEDDIAKICDSRDHSAQPRNFSISRKKLQLYISRLPDDAELERLFLEFIETRYGKSNMV